MIERLQAPVSAADLAGLAALLVDAVDSGAAVSFLAPLTIEAAEAAKWSVANSVRRFRRASTSSRRICELA
ncbi:MAG TPA: hypothetical protein VFD43_10455 [Planctomycetota bacterium]|nr:hypothetical protein [Planctomycetota bacterium]